MIIPCKKTTLRFFQKGWGDTEQLKALRNFPLTVGTVPAPNVKMERVRSDSDGFEYRGHFQSPFPHEYLPEESRRCGFRLYSPGKEFQKFPVCILFAMTGDQGYGYRYRSYSRRLLSKNIATLLIENPFYGERRPHYQQGFYFSTVADMLAMALAAVQEGRALIEWLSEMGTQAIGVAGVSQAAMIAGGVGALSSRRVAVACSLVAHSAEVILCDGLLKTFVDWKAIDAGGLSETRYRLIEVFQGTDLTRLPRPNYPKATFLQGAYYDLIAPRYSVKMIHRLWPGSQLRWLPGTHLTSLGLHKGSVCRLIRDSFAQL